MKSLFHRALPACLLFFAAALLPVPARCQHRVEVTNRSNVTVDGKTIMRMDASAGGYDSSQRAEIVRKRLRPFAERTDLRPQDITVKSYRGGRYVILRVGDQNIVMIGGPLAEANRSTPMRLAQEWADNLRQTLTGSNLANWRTEERQKARRWSGAHNIRAYVRQPRTIEVTIKNRRFHPSTIHARPGERLQIELTNQDWIPHNMKFDLPGRDVIFGQNLLSVETETLSLVAPLVPGRYNFYSPVADDRQRGLWGTLIVRN